MALPAWEKTWEMVINTAVGGTGVNITDNKDAVLKFIQLFYNAAFTTPCTVWGSCDGAGGAGSFGNADGVNRIADASDLIYATPGSNHTWIVLNLPGMGAKTALCIDYNTAQPYAVTLALSSAAGFGLANGGANGTATARPTATDEITWSNFQPGVNATYTAKHHMWMSSDGQCIRWITCRAGNSQSCLLIEKAKTPIAAWTSGVMMLALSNSAGYPGFSSGVRNAANWWARIGASNYAVVPGYEATYNTNNASPCEYFGSTLLSPMDVPTNEYPGVPSLGIWCATSPYRGRVAVGVYDLYWGPTGTFAAGDSMPGDGSNQAYYVGGLVLPGNGTALQVA